MIADWEVLDMKKVLEVILQNLFEFLYYLNHSLVKLYVNQKQPSEA